MRIENYLERGATDHGANAAVMAASGCHTYAELNLKSTRLAAALQVRGVVRGDRVALFMEDGWAAVMSIFAVFKAGGVVTPVDPSATSEQLVAALEYGRPVAIVTEARLASAAAAAIAAVESVRLVVLAGGDRTQPTDTCLSLEDTVNRTGRIRQPAAAGEDTDPAAILPGEAPLTHRSIEEAAAAHEISGGIVSLPPLTQRDGLSGLVSAIRAGATLVMKGPLGKAVEPHRHLAGRRPADRPVVQVLSAEPAAVSI